MRHSSLLITICLLFFLFLASEGKAQSDYKHEIDSLRHELPKLEGRELIQAYYEIYNLCYYAGDVKQERKAIDDLLAEAERQRHVWHCSTTIIIPIRTTPCWRNIPSTRHSCSSIRIGNSIMTSGYLSSTIIPLPARAIWHCVRLRECMRMPSGEIIITVLDSPPTAWETLIWTLASMRRQYSAESFEDGIFDPPGCLSLLLLCIVRGEEL